MDNRNILDEELFSNRAEEIWEEIDWWEKNRLLYNLILIGLEILLMLAFWEGTKRFGIGNSFVQSCLYTLVANVFFSGGWGLSIWLQYHFYYYAIGKKSRPYLLVLGIIFSIWLTVQLYLDVIA